MPGEVIIVNGEGGQLEGDAKTPEETPSVLEAKAAEEIAHAAIEISRIEADRDIIIAEIAAEARTAETEAVMEHNANQELEQCRTEIATLQAQLIEAEATIAVLSTPPPTQEPDPELQSPPSADVSNDPTKVSPIQPAQAEAKAPEPKAKRRGLRWI